MEERDVTPQIGLLVEYAKVLDASDEDQNPLLVGSVATQVRETVSPLCEVLEEGPRPWRNASGGAWLAMNSARSVEEQLALSELDWDRIGAAVSFTVSGVDQLQAKWTQALEGST
jgi:hypothetical protein